MKHLIKQIATGALMIGALWATDVTKAQTLSPQVSPSSGGYSTAGSVKLSWTMGQTFNSTLTAGSNKLTQGFQQPEIAIYTNSLASSAYPQGGTVLVPYTARGFYGAAHTFTAQLSNASGSFSSPVSIGAITSATSGTITATIPLATPLGTAYRVRVVSTSPSFRGTDNGTDITITSPSGTNTWLGGTTVWGTNSNWSLGVAPSGCGSTVVIPKRTNAPVISSPASVGDITFTGNTSLTVNAPLTVCGNWTGYDTAISVLGTAYVTFTGGANTFSKMTAINFAEMQGSYTIGTNPKDSFYVRNVLKMTSGSFTGNNRIRLVSNATQTAQIWDVAGNIAGNVIVERFIGGASGYHQLSSPVAGATVANMTGFTLSGTDGVVAYVNKGTLLNYNESANTHNTVDSGYYNYTNPSNPLTAAMGLSTSAYNTATIKFYGGAAKGVITRNITKLGSNAATIGWNLIGNPYPSPMSWTGLKNANTGAGMYASCYIWKPTSGTAGSWQTYNGTAGTNGLGDVISLGQGFFIQKTTAGTSTLSFDNSIRTQTATPYFYKSTPQTNEIRLSLTDANSNSTEALTYTEAGRTDAFDEDADATLPSVDGMNALSIAFAPQGQPYLINVTDAITEHTEIPVAIHTAEAGTYTIGASTLQVNGLPTYLLDRTTGTYTDLSREQLTIQTTAGQDLNRYSVVFGKGGLTGSSSVDIYGKAGSIAINRAAANTSAQIIVTNMLGQQVINTTTNASSIELPMETSAIYLVTVKQNGNETVKKVFVRSNEN